MTTKTDIIKQHVHIKKILLPDTTHTPVTAVSLTHQADHTSQIMTFVKMAA